MVDELVKDVRAELVGVARAGETITYKELAEAVGLKVDKRGAWRSPLFRALNAVCAPGPYMLSAVVVTKATGEPGEGLFSLAKKLRKRRLESDAAKKRFWLKELRKVHAHRW